MSIPNDNFNDGALGSGWAPVGAGATEAGGHLEIAPAGEARVGLRWTAACDVTNRPIPFKILNPHANGFNAVHGGVEVVDRSSGFGFRAFLRSQWNVMLELFDASGAVAAMTQAGHGVQPTDTEYVVEFNTTMYGGEGPGIEFRVSGGGNDRSIDTPGRIGPLPAAWLASFNPANVEVRVLAWRAGGSGTMQFDDVGGGTHDGTVGGPPPAPTSAALTITVTDDAGAPVAHAPVAVLSTDPAVATAATLLGATDAAGQVTVVVTGRAAGEAAVVALARGATASAEVTVTA